MSYDTDILAETGLVAYWPLNSSVSGTDSFGSNDLITGGTVNLSGPALESGLVGSAVLGGAGWLYTNTVFGATGDVSVECWVRLDDDAATDRAVWALGSDTGNNGYSLNVNAGVVRLLIHGIAYVAIGAPTLTEGVAYHIVFTRSGAGFNTTRLAINGSIVFDSNTMEDTTIVDGFTIGAHGSGGGRNFIGAISSLALYNVLLDDTTIADHYAAGQESTSPTEDPTRLSTFNANIADRHVSGAHPYPITCELAPPSIGENPRPYPSLYIQTGPNANEHYDPSDCSVNAQRYSIAKGLTPSDWYVNTRKGIFMWREGWIFKYGGATQGYHRHTHGLTVDYLMNGATLSRDAFYLMVPATTPYDKAAYDNTFKWAYSQRENAFRLMGTIDSYKLRGTVHPEMNWAVECALEHLAHFVKVDTSQHYGIYIRPFMIGLIFRSLVYYWFTFKDSVDSTIQDFRDQIPPAMEAMLNRIMAVAWWPDGVSHNIAFSGDYWDHGGIKYVYPAGGAYPQITDATVVSVVGGTGGKQFTIGAGYSSVDDFYKHMYVELPTGLTWCTGYVGSTRTMSIGGDAGIFATVGNTVVLTAQGGDDGAGGLAPDGSAPALNTLVSPGAAFCYWHRKFVLSDASGAAVFRDHYLSLFQGAYQAWFPTYTQKEWNETQLWGLNGIMYKEAGDDGIDTSFEPFGIPDFDPAVCNEAFLTGPTEGTIDQASLFTITLGSGTVTGTIVFTLVNMVDYNGNHYEGTFSVPTVSLTNSTRSGTFTFTPTGDEGGRIIQVVPDQQIAWPSPITFGGLVEAGGPVSSYSLLGPSSGYINSASSNFTVFLGSGTVTGTIRFTPQSSSGSGIFIPSFIDLDDSTRSGTFVYIPSSLGSRTITATDNAGLPDPAGITYEAIASIPGGSPNQDATFIPGDSVVIVGGVAGDRILIIPWDGKR